MKIRTKVGALALLAIALCGCESMGSNLPSAVVVAGLTPLPTSPQDSVQEVPEHGVVFQQTAIASELARLVEPAEGEIFIDIHARPTVRLNAGELLYRVAFMDQPGTIGYCSINVIDNAINTDGRVCLADEDSDGRFDRMWYLSEPGPISTIGGGDTRRLSNNLPLSAAYAPVSRDSSNPLVDEPVVTLVVTYECGYREGCVFRIFELKDGQRVNMGYRNFPVPRSGFPIEVDVIGARIEVLSNERRILGFRVVRPFPTDEMLPVIRYLPADGPIYIYY